MNTGKSEALEVERTSGLSSDSENGLKAPITEALDDDPEFPYAQQRKIIHRIDKRLVVTAGAMYCAALMDRSNLPNAAIAGMNVDLDMVEGFRYVGQAYQPVLA